MYVDREWREIEVHDIMIENEGKRDDNCEGEWPDKPGVHPRLLACDFASPDLYASKEEIQQARFPEY